MLYMTSIRRGADGHLVAILVGEVAQSEAGEVLDPGLILPGVHGVHHLKPGINHFIYIYILIDL